jgi:NAD(P)H-dependent FMN reductase
MRVLSISGSLQPESSNSQVLRTIATTAPPGLDITVWDELAEIPPFRPDTSDQAVPRSVASLRRGVASADLVVVATPEYAGGMPGTLKNAFDWLVGSGEFYGRPVVIVSVAPAPERGGGARRWAEETLAMQGAKVAASFTVALGRGHSSEASRSAAGRVLAAIETALDARPVT